MTDSKAISNIYASRQSHIDEWDSLDPEDQTPEAWTRIFIDGMEADVLYNIQHAPSGDPQAASVPPPPPA